MQKIERENEIIYNAYINLSMNENTETVANNLKDELKKQCAKNTEIKNFDCEIIPEMDLIAAIGSVKFSVEIYFTDCVEYYEGVSYHNYYEQDEPPFVDGKEAGGYIPEFETEIETACENAEINLNKIIFKKANIKSTDEIMNEIEYGFDENYYEDN